MSTEGTEVTQRSTEKGGRDVGVPDFDGIAGAYRWLEYGSLGVWLERARFCWLGRLGECGRALVLGDGDGRFTARLLGGNGRVKVTAVDGSSAMLRLLQRRCERYAGRLEVRLGDVREFEPEAGADLVVTHFFLDCLTDVEVVSLVRKVRAGLMPGALWVVSEFRVPEGGLHWPAWVFVRGLYFVFRLLTGLRVTQLPDYATAMRMGGFEIAAQRRFCFGLLTSEVWQLHDE